MSIETVKNFWDARPCNIRHSSAPLGTREYFDQVEAKKFFVEPHLPIFAEYEKYKGKKVLEIGCGIGTDSINFARAGAILTVIELSGTSLELCKKRFEVYNLKADFYEGNVEELSTFLPLNQYDLIYSWGVIHHTPRPEKAIKELTKYLNPGGELKLMLYSKFSYKLFWVLKNTDWEFSKMDETMAKYAEAQTGCPVAFTYTFDEIKDLLSDYNIIDIHKDHIFPYDVEEYVKGNYVIDKAFKDMDKKEFKKMEKELGWHTLVKAIKI